MEEKGIVARDCCPGFSLAWLLGSGAPAAGLRGRESQATIAGNNPFLLPVAVQSGPVEVGYQRCLRTRRSLVFSPNGSITQACVIVCVFTHTCGARTVVAHCLIGGPNSLGGQSRERGVNLAPYDDTWDQIPNRRV